MTRKTFNAAGAAPIAPYSHAAYAGDIIFCSGQLPLDASGKIVEGDIKAQTEQCFENCFNVLAAAGLTSDDVVKVTVFLTNMDDFAGMNEVYKNKFTPPYPARSAIGVAALPMGASIEIEMIVKG
ncbi:2-iminobutanoate/2-iminopropanoate deaminase [Natranaerovirga pectinivora]|uniref:2-iminobutanoate/2-iminopropanoate deaminase n=1 Tax=Natranaerovirga pectinivora TaxID=682400 RepID=A0A4R3MPL0_9FIRM|nr:Rid family detoxifying hydrolase [Natranaerovirga pectinivora]TCT14912.1 2-iminobutanoate/2-iminopropanoate deaminase [Natranaerovirga pectinivora]